METDANSFHVEFPDFSCSLLKKLNQQRQRGQLCDLIVSIGGHQFRAHRAVLAASSPYFCDQVLLKNSARVVLPDVMHPCVFEQLLLSCYTGGLSVPSGEVVSFLTAASFLQMWHVVDKCTELLEVGNKKKRIDSGASPKGDGYATDNDDASQTAGQGEDLADLDSALGQGMLESAGCSSPDDPSSENGSDAMENQCSRPAYVPPSIMGHRKKVQIKSERQTRDACGGLFGAEHTVNDSDENSHNPNIAEDCFDEKLVECLDRDCSYEEPLDFYGTSMEGFSQAVDELSNPASKDKLQAEGGTDVSKDEAPVDSGLKEQTSHSGFASVVYKLYPCQCGKSFTHKSQRDRHMSMHLGLRPFGCAVCGKSFKMKHHLVGHMKIHTGIKPYECSLCSKRFMWRDSFNRHTSTCARAHQTRRASQIC
ncbi:zinc finger and BTB domain-containing 43-like protein [Labeo rohita]|uniref:Zinc finger and BTB domain-containing 43-like protein n=2 Tax=Labeo rohita TaxID=84645 RepID=A0A498NI71_LABRO|nr:zinc finger and BTB domain-containing protein 43 [Labeo rohita]KAI2665045.1 Zinc finger and BTB domain-containing protein 43 [Labeo rohita]RXN31555.1 zinc finger and BTB domain-containing 43-like protein [Labeo rohita]